MLSRVQAFCCCESPLIGLTVKAMGALPVVRTAQAPGGSSSMQDAAVEIEFGADDGDGADDGGDSDADCSALAAGVTKHATSAKYSTVRRRAWTMFPIMHKKWS